MNLSNIIAKRILKKNKKNFSSLIVRLAIISVAIGISIMLVATSIVKGFQNNIKEKVSGFGSHLQITYFDLNKSYEVRPISSQQSFINEINRNQNVKNIQQFATKAGIIKQKEQIEGVVLKGVSSNYDFTFFKKSLLEGDIVNFNDTIVSNNILISKYTARRLNIKIKDKISIYFIQDPPRVRSFVVSGIYETGLTQFDNKYAIIDIKHIQKLYNWENSEIEGFEIILNDINKIDETYLAINNLIPYDLRLQTVRELAPELFEWIGLFDTNVLVIMILLIVICSITVTSTLLILILEQTTIIGIFKTIGLSNINLSKIFLYIAFRIIAVGLIIGNSIALLVSFIQKYFKIIKLNQELYYMDSVPIDINLIDYLLINSLILVITLLVIFLPIYLITRKVSIVQAIRYQ